MDHRFKQDYYRMTGRNARGVKLIIDLLTRYDIRYLYHIRSYRRGVVKLITQIRDCEKYGLEIYSSQIGEGLYIGHAHNINVHPNAIVGKNCNLNKGCTIGRENRGLRNGAPTLGDEVWVGANAVVVGKITIGNDVLIAPNAYVNFNVPDHSICIGNPAKIISKENATEGYIDYKV